MKMAVRLGDGGIIGQMRKEDLDKMRTSNHFLRFLAISAAALVVKCSQADGSLCNFERPCAWQGEKDGYVVTTASVIAANSSGPRSAPTQDADGNRNGHFLYYKGRSNDVGRNRQVSSPWINNSLSQSCRIEFMAHINNVFESRLLVLVETNNVTSVVGEHRPVAVNSWKQVVQPIGRKSQPFRILLEIEVNKHQPSHAAFDNIQLHDCLPERIISEECNNSRFECGKGICVDRSRICDLAIDCPGGEDEENCDVMLENHAYCNFENDTCGWNNSHDDDLEWNRTKGQQNLAKTGPSFDNTYKNASGHYVYLHTIAKKGSIGHKALLNSPVFPAPPKLHRSTQSPYAGSCQVRFYYHMHGAHIGDLVLNVIEIHPRYVGRNEIWRKYQSQGDNWLRETVTMPKNVTRRYYLQFVGTQSYKHLGRIAIDDISMSPECLGIGLPTDEPPIDDPTNGILDTVNETTKLIFSTCGSMGRRGPSQQQCDESYTMPFHKVTVVSSGIFTGTQQWIVPKTAYYSIIARGASGGEGVKSRGPSKGAMVRGVFNLTGGDILHMIVGQEGASACKPPHRKCPTEVVKRDMNVLLKTLNSDGTGGGGGGATYVFKIDEDNKPIPLLVAGGGGGLSFNDIKGNVSRADGREEAKKLPPKNGLSSPNGAGGGGGWNDTTKYDAGGMSLIEGAIGGATCSGVETWRTFGGFGGGGGACQSGGGGGGYSGGDAAVVDNPNETGSGGHSYSSGSYALVIPGESDGPGSVEVFTQFIGCECSHLCVVLDIETSTFGCMCPPHLQLSTDKKSCEDILLNADAEIIMYQHFLVAIPVTAIILLGVGAVMFFLYQRYRRQTAQPIRQDYSNNHEVQLNRLRPVPGGMMAVTEYNPNYEFGGSICTLQDLKEVPRDSLTLIKALGQGAFGEVYQGYLSCNPNTDTGGVPVAIKTLPELSSNQAEMDFLMEALIMSKFSHPNIVQFIGVCFEKLPKFIVLELLPGGDLKTFLRESRPKPQKQSTLTMKDLLLLSLDVAKGCHYLEENHFIHRDIAARNCLLTSKEHDKVVKIADFGMARDIYRADYYRKGGKAVLPVKWMPPEAFLDGIFTSKTDIWSFGVLLWEVLSLGYMPYPGRGNQEVMQLVTSGGLLEPPSNCPAPVYRIMTQCWHLIPDERPNFATILERLGYCIQDPDVINASLPVFHRPPSTERDTTVMRPPDSDNACLQVTRPDNLDHQLPASTDYLIPIPSSNYSLCTEKTDLQSASSVESVDRLLELDDHSGQQQQPPQLPCPPPTLSMLRPGLVQGQQQQMNASAWGEANANLSNRSSATPPTPTPTLTPNTTPTASGQSSPNPAAKATMMAAPAKHWAGYTSIPTHDDAPGLASIREGSIARRSPPSSIARQRPSPKQPLANLSGLSLDPSALVRQNPVVAPLPPPPAPPTTPIPYANVDVAMTSTDPYTITTSAVVPGKASNKNDLKC